MGSQRKVFPDKEGTIVTLMFLIHWKNYLLVILSSFIIKLETSHYSIKWVLLIGLCIFLCILIYNCCCKHIKYHINYRSFENVIIPKSYRTPYLILFYSDWCFACLQVEPTWRRLIDELEPLGLGLATAHAKKESTLARRLGIHSLPCLVVTLDGRTSVYKESLLSIQKIVGMFSEYHI